jgi:iron complex transport system substrate-binding protein
MGAERIASLLAAGTEILYGLGLGDRVVAVSHECDHPPAASERPRVTSANLNVEAPSAAIDAEVRELASRGAALYSIDVARLAALRPDLIVTQAQCEVCAVSYDDVQAAIANVEGLSDARVVALNPSSLEGVFDDIRRVASAAGCAERGEALVASLSARVDAVRTRVSHLGAGARPRVICIEWIEPLMVAANWMPELIRLAGGQCDLTRAGEMSGYTRWQDVAAYDPEVIVVAPCGFDLARVRREAGALDRLPGWAGLSAVRHGRVHHADGNALFNRSPRADRAGGDR